MTGLIKEGSYGADVNCQRFRDRIFADKIYNTDCMELLAILPDESVSMILTDPPYGISYCNNFTKRRHSILEGDGGMDYESFAVCSRQNHAQHPIPHKARAQAQLEESRAFYGKASAV